MTLVEWVAVLSVPAGGLGWLAFSHPQIYATVTKAVVSGGFLYLAGVAGFSKGYELVVSSLLPLVADQSAAHAALEASITWSPLEAIVVPIGIVLYAIGLRVLTLDLDRKVSVKDKPQ